MGDNTKIIASISKCNDPDKLRTWIKNARNKNASDVADSTFRRLISIVPSEQPGTVEHDFWQSIHAFEHILLEERGKTVRLSRTRQKISRVGIMQTMRDLALSDKKSDGFEMLMERGMPEITAEAVILRHTDKFDSDVLAAARERLSGAGVDVDRLPTKETS